jgi:hypothetical protein
VNLHRTAARGGRVAGAAARRAFSMVELMIAFTISTLMLTACLVALDSTFKSYEHTTESASTHVVSRLVMTRLLAMIRQGEEFGPYPMGVLVPTSIESAYLEFVSLNNPSTGERQVTRIEKVADPDREGSSMLSYKRWDYLNGVLTGSFDFPLIKNVKEARFTLEYDVGPKLRRATVDLTVEPEDARTNVTAISQDLHVPVLRLIASTSPRRLD